MLPGSEGETPLTQAPEGIDPKVKGGAERRATARVSMLLLATIRYDDMQPPVTSRILDLSRGGIRTTVPCVLKRGHPVKVSMKGVGEVRGQVVWARNGEVGIRFAARIDTNAVIQALTGAPAATHIEFAKGPVPRPGFHVR